MVNRMKNRPMAQACNGCYRETLLTTGFQRYFNGTSTVRGSFSPLKTNELPTLRHALLGRYSVDEYTINMNGHNHCFDQKKVQAVP